MSDAYTHLNLNDIDDAAPGNGFADRWEARVARGDLGSDQIRPNRRHPLSIETGQAVPVLSPP